MHDVKNQGLFSETLFSCQRLFVFPKLLYLRVGTTSKQNFSQCVLFLTAVVESLPKREVYNDVIKEEFGIICIF